MKSGALQRSPEKVAAWTEKHRRAFAARGGLRRSEPARRKPKPALRIPPETRAEVKARSGGKCVVCLYRGKRHPSKAAALHHCFPKQENRWPELALVGDGMVGVCKRCHDDHEYAPDGPRIPLLALPECVFRLAADVSQAAVDYLLRTYAQPTRGGTAHDGRRRDGE
jgi:cytochrome c553